VSKPVLLAAVLIMLGGWLNAPPSSAEVVRKRGTRAGNDSKWPEHALVLDTETRVTADPSLIFGLRASESTSPPPSLGSYLVVIIGTAKPDVV
jgi:hypothetical protein